MQGHARYFKKTEKALIVVCYSHFMNSYQKYRTLYLNALVENKFPKPANIFFKLLKKYKFKSVN